MGSIHRFQERCETRGWLLPPLAGLLNLVVFVQLWIFRPGPFRALEAVCLLLPLCYGAALVAFMSATNKPYRPTRLLLDDGPCLPAPDWASTPEGLHSAVEKYANVFPGWAAGMRAALEGIVPDAVWNSPHGAWTRRSFLTRTELPPEHYAALVAAASLRSRHAPRWNRRRFLLAGLALLPVALAMPGVLLLPPAWQWRYGVVSTGILSAALLGGSCWSAWSEARRQRRLDAADLQAALALPDPHLLLHALRNLEAHDRNLYLELWPTEAPWPEPSRAERLERNLQASGTVG